MGREIRNRIVSVRFTDNEFVDLGLRMSLEGYKSTSRYLREKAIGERIKRRDLSRIDTNALKQVEVLSASIRRIGNNYNQVVKAVNTAVGLRSKSGNPVVSTRSMEHQLIILRNMMKDILDTVAEVNVQLNQ